MKSTRSSTPASAAGSETLVAPPGSATPDQGTLGNAAMAAMIPGGPATMALGSMVSDWWSGGEEEEGAAVEAEAGQDDGWGDYVPGIARGFYDGLFGVPDEAPEAEQPAPEALPATGGDERTLQTDLVGSMLDIGYDDDGTQATRYGGFSGMGSEYSNGEGGYWVAAGTEDPIRSVGFDTGKVDDDGKPIKEYRWIGQSGEDYGKSPSKEFRASDEYHCVGAVSTVLEQAGLYEGQGPLDGAADVTHTKDGTWRESVEGQKKKVTKGKAEGVQTRGGGSGDYSLKALVNVATFSGASDLKASTASDSKILTDAKAAATAEADAKLAAGEFESTSDPAYQDFVLRSAYDALLTSDRRDERLAGSATALEKSGFGREINPCDAKPGDTCQHWSDSTSGHATLVHVVIATGVAKVDEAGKVSADGTWKDGAFTMDDKSAPELVGQHFVRDVRLLGAHSKGTADYNQGEKKATDGIHTGEARAIGSKKLEYYGRPDNSRWNAWTARFATVEEAMATETGPEPAEAGAGNDDGGGTSGTYGLGKWLGAGVKGLADTASSVKDGVSAAVWGPEEEEEEAAPAEAPAAQPAEVATRACPGVAGCDYIQHADGRIELTAPKSRMFSPGDTHYDAILAEIEGVYGKWVA